MATKRAMSAPRALFAALLVAVFVTAAGVTGLLVWDSQRANHEEAEHLTSAMSATIASSPEVREQLRQHPAPEGPDGALQRSIEKLRAATGMSYITVMDRAGIRHSHRNPEEIGSTYLGTIPADPAQLTEQWTGTLGPSVRTITPIFDTPEDPGSLLGWVSVGLTVDTIWDDIRADIPLALAFSLGLAAVGVCGAVLGRSYLRRMTGDLPSTEVRDAVASYESFRVLSEALRAQTHEHGNRMHTVLGLIELGRSTEAAELLAATSSQSQQLADLIAMPGSIDPAVSALLLGKTAGARERGVSLTVTVMPDSPGTRMDTMNLISVLGNLIDNAIEAAATGADAARSVHVSLSAQPGDHATLQCEVSDSGGGVPSDPEADLFAWGYSTKNAGGSDRGSGLAIVKQLLATHGGGITVERNPTRFVVTFPSADRP